jgi:hypothetical protein
VARNELLFEQRPALGPENSVLFGEDRAGDHLGSPGMSQPIAGCGLAPPTSLISRIVRGTPSTIIRITGQIIGSKLRGGRAVRFMGERGPLAVPTTMAFSGPTRARDTIFASKDRT